MSRFLPPDFAPSAPLALIAGKGQYPLLLAERARAAGISLRLIAFRDDTEESLYQSFPENERVRIKVGQLGKMLKALQSMEARYTVMAGQITPRRLFKGLHPDFKALAILNSLKEKNAETIFGAIAQEINDCGIAVLDARVFMDEDLAAEGILCGKMPKKFSTWLEHGIRIASGIAQLDVGQGVVVRQGTVLAVEAFEGTDAMLERAGQFKTRNALFVKTVKPGQDYRFDVPVFGSQTLKALVAAEIHHVALAAGSVILLNQEGLLTEATRQGINITGFTTP